MELDEKTVVVIEVPRADRRDKPVYVGQDMFKGTYRRNYEGDYHCSSEEIKAMLRDQAETSQDALMLENLMIGDLNQESIFSLINVGERSGTGLCNVYHVWKENGFISSVIEETIEPERITVTLQMTEDAGQSSAGKSSKEGISYVRDGNFGENESNSDGNEGNMDANEGNHDGNEGNLNVNEGNHDGNEGNPSNGKSIYEKNIDDFALTKNESLILKAIMKNPEISAVKIADQCGISKSTAERGLRSLKKKGIIRRQGSTRGKWIVV